MSKFSGNFDFADYIELCGLDHVLCADIYVGNDKLMVQDYKDLVPYLAHGVSMTSGNTIKLSQESIIDLYEKKFIQSWLNTLVKIYNQQQNKNIEFDAESAVQEVCNKHFYCEKGVVWKLIDRIFDYEDEYKKRTFDNKKRTLKQKKWILDASKVNIEGIHIELNESFRKKLKDEMFICNTNP